MSEDLEIAILVFVVVNFFLLFIILIFVWREKKRIGHCIKDIQRLIHSPVL